jgi:hypothetical protein
VYGCDLGKFIPTEGRLQLVLDQEAVLLAGARMSVRCANQRSA